MLAFSRLDTRCAITLASLLLVTAGARETAQANAPAPGADTPAVAPPAPGRLLVQFQSAAFSGRADSRDFSAGRTGLASADARLALISARSVEPVFDLTVNAADKRAAGLDRIFAITFDAGVDPVAAASLVAGPEFVFVEPDFTYRALTTTPDDPNYGDQWGHHNPVFPFGWTEDSDADADIAWDHHTGDPNRIIAILDTGVDAAHPEFAGRIVAGWDYINGDNDPHDDNGHGTSCAGIAAAAGNNGMGIAGVVWNAKILPVKVLAADGFGSSTAIANGITFAADNGASVISMSLGSDSPSTAIQNAVNYAFNTRGALLLGATGNDNDPVVSYPAAFANCMGVGAMSPCLERKNPDSCDGEGWWGSNYGTEVDFLAPGVRIYTTDITGDFGYQFGDYYAGFNGTSSATPYAAGAAALVWSYRPTLTNVQLRDLLRASAEDMATPGFDNETGYGHINPASAIQHLDFTDATTGSLGNTGVTRGVAWGDYDGDDDADLYITNSGTSNKLLRNDAGTFVDVTAAPMNDAGDSYGSVFGDPDHDGDLDLYLAKTGANRYFRNDGGTFVDATAAPLGNADAGTSVSWIDYENDGDLDLYLLNYGSANVLFRNDGATFSALSDLPLGNTREGRGVAWGDYDNDGDADVFIANQATGNRLLRNDGSGVFVNTTSTAMQDASLDTNAAAWSDMDNDGDLDLFVANNGANRLWRNDGGTFTNVALPLFADSRNSIGAAWADYDLDGDEDLFVTNEGSPDQLFRNESGISFSSIAALGPIAATGVGQGVAWADYDLDGDLDFYVARGDGANRLLRNDQTGGAWLEVRLEGTVSNSFGIGTRVRIVNSGVTQIREITAGMGFCSQNETIAHFGLAGASTIDTLEVSWSSGTVDLVTAVTANARITIVEGEGLPTSVADAGETGVLQLAQNTPNPFFGTTDLRFRTAVPMDLSLRIFDASGRLVRTLVEGAHEAGEHSASWDRMDDRGRTVPAGIFFYRLEASGQQIARRMIVLE